MLLVAVTASFVILKIYPRHANNGVHGGYPNLPVPHPVYNLPLVVHDLVLWSPWASFADAVLWSLHYEVVFSLGLPLFLLLLGKRLKDSPTFAGIFAVASGAALFYLDKLQGNVSFLAYTSYWPFILGVVAAFHSDRLLALWRSLPALSKLTICLLAFLVYSLSNPFLALHEPNYLLASGLMAVPFFLVAMTWRPLVAFLKSKPVQWLGVRSYGLYIFHLPILLAFSQLSQGVPWCIPLAVLGTLLLTDLTHRFVEKPAYSWGKRLLRGRKQLELPATMLEPSVLPEIRPQVELI